MELNYNFVSEDIDIKHCEVRRREDGTYETSDDYDLCDYLDSLSEEELEEYYKEQNEDELEEKYSKMDLDELERRDFRRKYPTIDCDGCGEVHNTEDMDLGIDATGQVVLVLCKKCAGK